MGSPRFAEKDLEWRLGDDSNARRDVGFPRRLKKALRPALCHLPREAGSNQLVLFCRKAKSALIVMDGPRVHLSSTLAQGFALIVHELATNAVKHGALSQDGGSIAIDWSVSIGASETTLLFRWQERGGPLVLPPTRKSFGTVLLERAVPSSGIPPRLHYGPQGFSYEHSVKLVS